MPCSMRGDGQNSPGHREDMWGVVEPPHPWGPFQNQGTACEVSGSLTMSRLRLQQSVRSAETTGSEFLRGGWREPSTLQPPGAARPHPHLAQSTRVPRALCGARSSSRQAGRQRGSPSSAGSRTRGEKNSKPQTRAQHRPAPCSVRACSQGARQAFPPPGQKSPAAAHSEPRGTRARQEMVSARALVLAGALRSRGRRGITHIRRAYFSAALRAAPEPAAEGQAGLSTAAALIRPRRAAAATSGAPPGPDSQEGLALAPSSPTERHGGSGAKGQGPSVPTPSHARAKAAVKESPGAPPCQVSSSAFCEC